MFDNRVNMAFHASPRTHNRIMRKYALFALAFMFVIATANAAEIAGIDVPEQLATARGDTLRLNGAGVRSKFFIKVYVGALYLPTPTHSAATILQHDGPAVMQLHIVHSEISEEKLVKAWTEGFEDNLNGRERSALAARVHKFNSLFRTVRKGETITLDYQPGSGTIVRINNEKRGVIEGADFARGWLKIWLGEDPADEGLKQRLLGGPG